MGVKMAKSEQSWGIPTELSPEQFRQFVLPHLTVGRRGPAPKLSLHTLFNYILKILYLGCQWKELPIAKDADGRPEIHYTRIMAPFGGGRPAAVLISFSTAVRFAEPGFPKSRGDIRDFGGSLLGRI